MNNNILNKLSNYTLLFVENEKGIRDNFSEYFNLLFKEVYIGEDGEDGYLLYEKYKPDLIITDIKMPKMSGIELVSKVRQIDAKTSIVIISAHTEVELLLQSIPLSLIEYVIKPLNSEKLNSIFTKFLNTKIDTSFVYNKEKSEVLLEGELHKLNYKENLFLDKLANQNRIISYDEIEFDIWDGKEMSQNALRLFIKNLRKKLPKDYIKNVPNHGYCKNLE